MTWNEEYKRLIVFHKEYGNWKVLSSHSAFIPLAKWIVKQKTEHTSLEPDQIRKLLDTGISFCSQEDRWYRHFFELQDHVKKHKAFPPHRDSRSRWLEYQRKLKNDGTLSLQRTRWLNTLNVVWKIDVFADRYEELKAFHARYGHSNVPRGWPENPGLSWYVGNTLRGKKDKLRPDQIRKLNALKFVWDVYEETWQKHFDELKIFVGKFQAFPTKLTHPRLASWIRSQRKHEQSEERIDKLNKINFPWNPREEQWMARYLELKAFRKRHGHCRVPSEDAPYQQLWKWLHFQKTQRKKMSRERRKLLAALAIDWTITERISTEDRFRELKTYFRKNGHCNVTISENRKLAAWLTTIRRNRGKLPSEVKKRLEAMQIDWSPLQSAFERRLKEFSAFREKEGHGRIPTNTDLGQWVLTQRKLYQRGQLSPDRQKRLNALGFEWEEWDKARWEEHFRKLAAFREEFGHCQVSPQYDEKMADWVYRQRHYKKRLSREQVHRLNAIHFPWNAKKPIFSVTSFIKDRISWKQRFRELERFQCRHGHCRVFLNDAKHPDLAQWVAYQRENWSKLSQEHLLALIELDFTFKPKDVVWLRRFSELAKYTQKSNNLTDLFQESRSLSQWIGYQKTIKKKLSNGQIRLLEEAGMEWSPKKDAWKKQYEKLAEFRRLHGHCQVPKAHDLTLAAWTYHQRMHRERLSAEQKRLLTKIGFQWNPDAEALERRFRQLTAFKKKYGHCRVPSRSTAMEAEFPGLGRWVEGQRIRRKKLPSERIAQLNAMGFEWPEALKSAY